MKANRARLNNKVLCISLSGLLSCTIPAEKIENKDLSIVRQNSKYVTIVHSRSGNTAVMARALSELLQTDYIRIEAPDGIGDSFFSSPNRNKIIEIKPKTVNLEKYSLVIIGSPIWYWYPTAVIYSFLKNNSLKDKKVILFYSYEGGISKAAVSEWQEMVKSSEGKVIDVIGINRKIFKSGKEIENEIKRIVEMKKNQWMEN